jgi:hypothetical protein
LQNLRKEVKSYEAADGAEQQCLLLILPVMIPGGPYAENNERRLRTRQAVISGLAVSGFTPKDGERIGYFLLPQPDLSNSVAESPSLLSARVVPYEWFGPRYDDPNLANPEGIAHILILWVRDDLPGATPLNTLSTLGEALEWDASKQNISVIGPGTSTSLTSLLKEDDKMTQMEVRLSGIGIYAPMPTAASSIMALSTNVRTDSSIKKLKSGATLYRTINTDDEVAEAIIDELKRRRVDLRENLKVDLPKNRNALQHIAVISEWDTVYGRSLPLTLLAQIYPDAPSRELREFMRGKKGGLGSGSKPEWFHSFTYLRGIDGRLPADGAPEKSKPPQAKEAAAPAQREATEGEDQSDYLRRLAGQLAAMHWDLKRTGGEGLKAVGILGSDVYDKLMILRALRSALPGVLFFTNNLDARLGLKEEWPATHNLIVASPFGLSLKAKYQRNIAPFRDTYQTSVFASTLMITKVMPRPKDMRPPRIFEIGRNGPWDLSDTQRSFDPPRLDIRSWWGNPSRRWSGLFIMLALLALMLWIAVTASWIGLPKNAAQRWRFGSIAGALFANSSVVMVLAVSGSAVLIWGLYRRQCVDGEPLAFAQGISIWPTEMLRVIVIALCAHFVWKSVMALDRSNEEIKIQHGLAGSQRQEEEVPPPNWRGSLRRIALAGLGELKATWERLKEGHLGWQTESLVEPEKSRDVPSNSGPSQATAELENVQRIKADKLWEEYLDRGRWSARVRRFGPLVLFYLIGGGALFLLLGFPTVPARGSFSFKIDRVLLMITTVSTTILLFYVVDAIRLNRDLIALFNQGITQWPERARLISPRHRLLNEEELSEYLDIRLIAARTEVVCPLVNYPFVILVLMIVARNSYFDNWDWPWSLIIILALNLAWAIYCSVQLYRAARKARRTALDRLSEHRLHALYQAGIVQSGEQRAQLQTRVKMIEETVGEIRHLSRGAFAPLSDQPFFRAILFTSGSIGIGSLMKFLPNLF